MKKGKRIILAISGISAALLGAGGFFLASFTVHGSRQTLEEAMKWQASHYDVSWYDACEKTDYTISGYDGYVLHAQLLSCPSGGSRYVILSHGYTDNRLGSLKYARLYLDAGFNCILYDLRGHGENEKAICTYSILESRDLAAVIRDTKKRFGQDITLGLHGESLGAATSVAVLAYEQGLAFVTADCGFADIRNVLRGAVRHMHLPSPVVSIASLACRLRYGYFFGEMRPVGALRGNTVPILFLHGEEDDFILPENSEQMHRAASGYSELHTIPGAGHAQSVLVSPELYRQYLYGFLETVKVRSN